ncbi:major tail protein [Microbacterium phage Platte]|nr:hypothetical protein SEA_HORTUS1_45 [Microbacterium phage Hortus1]AWY05869.1 hypothetical protein SEA_PIONEER3_45 [Microbacterium phage Pioneer3]AWY06375.1 hypothetical protein SEA_TANDEM_45 [Microbacterium phage Tandem]QAU07378.1 hypothetical protein SEA_ALLEB_46 [Microbacterium phage Alleb]QZD97638.1 major tail protein [Microbacterium phage Platte]
MVDERLDSRGNVRYRFYNDAAFANYRWPTVAELNAGLELEQVTVWDGFEVGAQASDTSDAIPIAAKATVTRRAAANYGGSSTFWYPGYRADNTNAAALVYTAFKNLHTPGFLALSVDGEIGSVGQPASDLTFANGDYVSIMRIVTDEWTDQITGEEAFSYTRNFLKAGGFAPYTVASTTAPVLDVTATAASGAVGANAYVSATVNGRDYTRGVRWTSSDPAVATVSSTGVVRRLSAGTATITGILPGTTATTTDTVEITVT